MSESPFPGLEIQIRIGSFKTTAFALIDTGFSGGIILPESARDNLGHRDGLATLRLADEQRIAVELFRAVVVLENREMIVKGVVVGNQFIIGRSARSLSILHRSWTKN
jgi:predicted aspartyl protease